MHVHYETRSFLGAWPSKEASVLKTGHVPSCRGRTTVERRSGPEWTAVHVSVDVRPGGDFNDDGEKLRKFMSETRPGRGLLRNCERKVGILFGRARERCLD